MDVPDLTRQRHVIAKKPVHTGRGLQIELESAANIGRANPHGRYSRAQVKKRNQSSPRSEVVTQMRSEADEPTICIDVRMKLHASK